MITYKGIALISLRNNSVRYFLKKYIRISCMCEGEKRHENTEIIAKVSLWLYHKISLLFLIVCNIAFYGLHNSPSNCSSGVRTQNQKVYCHCAFIIR